MEGPYFLKSLEYFFFGFLELIFCFFFPIISFVSGFYFHFGGRERFFPELSGT